MSLTEDLARLKELHNYLGGPTMSLPCKYALTGCMCTEMILCTAAIAGEPINEQDCYEQLCLWEVYQANQTYENCCKWLKHRAWTKSGWRR